MSKQEHIIKTIQKKMRKVLDQQDCTLEESAINLGITRNTLYLNLNKDDIHLSFILKFCDYYGLNYSEFLCFEEEKISTVGEPLSNFNAKTENVLNNDTDDSIKKMLLERISELKYTISIQNNLLEIKEMQIKKYETK